MQTTVALLKDVFGLAREALIVLVIAVLVLAPSKINSMLAAAGFTSGSIGGFEWKNQYLESAEVNKQAQDRISQLEGQLKDAQMQLKDISARTQDPAVKTQAETATQNIQQAQTQASTTSKAPSQAESERLTS